MLLSVLLFASCTAWLDLSISSHDWTSVTVHTNIVDQCTLVSDHVNSQDNAPLSLLIAIFARIVICHLLNIFIYLLHIYCIFSPVTAIVKAHCIVHTFPVHTAKHLETTMECLQEPITTMFVYTSYTNSLGNLTLT